MDGLEDGWMGIDELYINCLTPFKNIDLLWSGDVERIDGCMEGQIDRQMGSYYKNTVT